MPRTKTAASLEADIARTLDKLEAARRRCDKLTGEIEDMQKELKLLKAQEILAAFEKSDRTWDELMVFLKTR